ncbi:MAG: hypothetical protein CV090_09790 [Nitrospira sp. WS238]|nr:hypothetical protein [Nitrospira sp. WS238]
MERFDIIMDALDSMITDSDGAFVRFDEAQHLIDALRGKLNEVTQERDRLRALIVALPKVGGEITVSQQVDSAWRLKYWKVHGIDADGNTDYLIEKLCESDANAYAFLLRERQGMEGG